MSLGRLVRNFAINAGVAYGMGHVRELVENAEREFRGFHWGRPAKRVRRERLPETEGVLVEIGELLGLAYRTDKGGDGEEDWLHWHDEPRPRLAYDPDTRDLFILGGGYTVTDRGIED